MRTMATLVAILLLSATAHAQDRLVTLSDSDVIEAAIAGTTISPPLSVTPLPRHGFRSHQLVSMAGGRYVAWIAGVSSGPSYSDCREYVAVFDRRLRTGQVVPGLEMPCDITKLASDPRRPRLFLHAWSTASGAPGFIASIDEHLTVRPLVRSTASMRLGTAFAYAADADQLVATYLGAPGDPQLRVGVFSGSTGELVRTFPVRDGRNLSTTKMQVTADGRRVFLYTAWGDLLPFEQEIRAFDTETGAEVAASAPVYLGGGYAGDYFILDEARQRILTPHVKGNPYPYPPVDEHLLAFDATTLTFIGDANAGGYPESLTFQPLAGRGAAAAYLLHAAGSSAGCDLWVDAFDSTGTLRTRADLPGCVAAGIILSPPDAPSELTATVTGQRVTLAWTNPGDTSDFEIEVGVAPGRRDLSVRVGLVTEYAVDDVPPGVYYVRVHAINEIGESPVSNEIQIVIP